MSKMSQYCGKLKVNTELSFIDSILWFMGYISIKLKAKADLTESLAWLYTLSLDLQTASHHQLLPAAFYAFTPLKHYILLTWVLTPSFHISSFPLIYTVLISTKTLDFRAYNSINSGHQLIVALDWRVSSALSLFFKYSSNPFIFWSFFLFSV